MSQSYGAVVGRMTDADLLTTSPGSAFVALRQEVCGPFTTVDILDDSLAP